MLVEARMERTSLVGIPRKESRSEVWDLRIIDRMLRDRVDTRLEVKVDRTGHVEGTGDRTREEEGVMLSRKFSFWIRLNASCSTSN